MHWVAPCSRAAPARPSSRCRPWPSCRPAGYIGTPSFLKLILEKAQDLGVALPSLTKALVSGEAFPPSLRDWLPSTGVTAYQCYATADLGLIAYETSAREGLVLDEGVIVEIVRPGTGGPRARGRGGELVITTLNPDYPLIRFGTGDLSAVLPGTCPTGRTNLRIKGWMGRADQTTKVRGMFVHPGQVSGVRQALPPGRQGPSGGQRRHGQRPDDDAGREHRDRARPGAADRPRPCAKLPSCAPTCNWCTGAACPTTAR